MFHSSTTSQSVLDELAFPVRVKVAQPERGLNQLFEDAFIWLNREVGHGNYAKHSAMTLGAIGVAFHFRDVESARRFLEAFPNLRLADGTATAAYRSPPLPFGRKRPSEPGKP